MGEMNNGWWEGDASPVDEGEATGNVMHHVE
jgi:hypothetical protein